MTEATTVARTADDRFATREGGVARRPAPTTDPDAGGRRCVRSRRPHGRVSVTNGADFMIEHGVAFLREEATPADARFALRHSRAHRAVIEGHPDAYQMVGERVRAIPRDVLPSELE